MAVGFVLGGAVSKLVSAIVTDVVNPVLGLALGFAEGLKTASLSVGSAKILYGDFITVLIDFLVVALVVYFGVKFIGLERLNSKKKS